MAAVEVVVHGRVQDVFFRDTCSRQADAAGVTGWVRNDSAGTVTARFEGAPEAVDRLVQWCRLGPPDARVDDVQATSCDEAGFDRFVVRS